MMEASNGISARLDELFRRADRADKVRAEQWKSINEQGKEMTGFSRDVENIREDIKDLSDQVRWLRRGMWAAAATFSTFILMLAGVLAAVLS